MDIFETLEKQSNVLPEKYRNMSTEKLEKRVTAVKEKMGDKLFIPGHHYQKDEVIQFADATGDSLKLAQLRSEEHTSELQSRFDLVCRLLLEKKKTKR